MSPFGSKRRLPFPSLVSLCPGLLGDQALYELRTFLRVVRALA
jgi:hypothetical protein